MKAIHEVFGAVEVVTELIDDGFDVDHYGCKCESGGLIWAEPHRLTFPPHAEYWRPECSRGNAMSPKYETESSAMGARCKECSHVAHHWQQDEDGPWQCEVVEAEL